MSQCKAARFVFNNNSRYCSVTNMLHKIKKRRTKATIIMFYKIINNIVYQSTFQNVSKDQQPGQAVIN